MVVAAHGAIFGKRMNKKTYNNKKIYDIEDI